MKTATVAEVMAQFDDFVESSADSPVLLTRDGKPVAVLLGVESEDDVERLLMSCSPRLREILDSSREQIASGKGVGHEEFWADTNAK